MTLATPTCFPKKQGNKNESPKDGRLSIREPEEIKRRIATALGVDPESVRIDAFTTEYSCSVLRGTGNAGEVRFFAKIPLAEPYRIPPRFATPWEEVGPEGEPTRSIGEQIETEWARTRLARKLTASGNVPAPLGRSAENGIIVFEEVKGQRLDRTVSWLGVKGSKVRAVENALCRAGMWLKGMHDASHQKYETVDVARSVPSLRDLLEARNLETTCYGSLALGVLEAAVENIGPGRKLEVSVALNHGDFSLPNLIWDKEGERLWVFDFEHSSYRPILHDLCTMIFTLRHSLLRPLTSPRVVQRLEEAFWTGYGTISEDTRTFINGLSCARLFYYSLPRISTLRERRGWRGSIKASVYKSLLERSMITRILQVQRSYEPWDSEFRP